MQQKGYNEKALVNAIQEAMKLKDLRILKAKLTPATFVSRDEVSCFIYKAWMNLRQQKDCTRRYAMLNSHLKASQKHHFYSNQETRGITWHLKYMQQTLSNALHEKSYFLFPNVLKRWSFQKKEKLHWNMVFLVSWGKTIFLFPENMILFLRQKMKDDLSQKEYMEVWYIFKMLWKDSLSKNIALEYYLSYITRKDGISFFCKCEMLKMQRWSFTEKHT